MKISDKYNNKRIPYGDFEKLLSEKVLYAQVNIEEIESIYTKYYRNIT